MGYRAWTVEGQRLRIYHSGTGYAVFLPTRSAATVSVQHVSYLVLGLGSNFSHVSVKERDLVPGALKVGKLLRGAAKVDGLNVCRDVSR